MITVNLFDNNFRHSIKEIGFDSASFNKLPTKIKYVRDNMQFNGITVFTDSFILDAIVDKVECDVKIGWCQESPIIYPLLQNLPIEIENKFDYIVTSNKKLIQKNPHKYKYLPIACCWVSDIQDIKYEKDRLLSHVVSNKHNTIGHLLRHKITSFLTEKNISADIYGYKRFNTKKDPHERYMFSIIVENGKIDGYFSEKLIDCLIQGTIPIYWGDPNIGDYFNVDGIIPFNDVNEIAQLVINEEDYIKRKRAIKENIDICRKKFICVDDNLADLLQTNLK